VIYIIKENRSYDQVMGDDVHGNGDPSLTLFPRAVTPNHHALADRFGLMDNFYADAEVSADGHNWVMSANASDYNEKFWPQFYAGNRGNRPYDMEGGSRVDLSPGGYLWDSAAAAHISYRNYGEFYLFDASYGTKHLIPATQSGSCTGPVTTAYTGTTIPAGQALCFAPMDINASVAPNLVGHYDPRFRNYDMHYPESERVAEWKREFLGYVAHNTLPRLEILRLPTDHTAGTSVGGFTPDATMAQNDLALGQVVDIVSHSKYWASTAIFVTEDDAQNGPDHVDAHRTVGFVISPYTGESHPTVDHTLYDTASMIRTIELILGLHPMSQYDASAVPMWRMFHSKPDLRPYTALAETVSTTAVNGPHAFGARASGRMDFTEEDHAPMDGLNHILWHAIKGARTPYPRFSR
jgi:phospholipase C